jgi:hypothetical protein
MSKSGISHPATLLRAGVAHRPRPKPIVKC